MGYRLDKYEFLKTNQFKAFQRKGKKWSKCEDYEVEEPRGGKGVARVRAMYPRSRKDRWTEYWPLDV